MEWMVTIHPPSYMPLRMQLNLHTEESPEAAHRIMNPWMLCRAPLGNLTGGDSSMEAGFSSVLWDLTRSTMLLVGFSLNENSL